MSKILLNLKKKIFFKKKKLIFFFINIGNNIWIRCLKNIKASEKNFSNQYKYFYLNIFIMNSYSKKKQLN